MEKTIHKTEAIKIYEEFSVTLNLRLIEAKERYKDFNFELSLDIRHFTLVYIDNLEFNPVVALKAAVKLKKIVSAEDLENIIMFKIS